MAARLTSRLPAEALVVVASVSIILQQAIGSDNSNWRVAV